MKIVLIGIQGAGKSTQGNLLSEQLKIPYLSTGHIFRELAKERTKLGRYIKETLNAGILIPDNKTIQIVDEYLLRPEYQNGYILDGFPRTINQAKKFRNNVDKVIYLEVPDKEALWRLAYRNDTSRGDETLPALKKRIELFHQYTQPVVKYYEKEGKLAVIDGTRSIKEVNQEILKNIGKQLLRNRIEEWNKKQKTIVALVGLPGSGKTEAANYFRKKNIPVISFGEVVNEYIDKHNLTHTEKDHKKIRNDFRKKFGIEAFAVLNKEKIQKALTDNIIVVIDGMRSWEEFTYLKKEFPDVKICIVGFFTDKNIRYKRIAKRKYRSQLFGKQRDINELLDTNMGPTIAFADYMIKNNYSIHDFHDKLEELYRKIYFS